MALDPRIALMGTQWQAPDFQGALAKGQEYRTNQMAMERQVAAQAALQNFMRPPPAVAAPTMQLGSSGPPITGAPVNAARDMSTLYQFMDIPEVKNYVDEMNRQETARVTAAGRATDDERLGDANTRARVQFTVEQSMPLWGLASVNPTDEELIAARDRTLAIPGVDAALVNQTYAPVLAMPFEGRVRYMADMSNSYAQSRAAEELRAPGSEDFNAGDRITFRPEGGRARLPGEVPPDIAVALTPGQVQAQQNRDVDRAAPDFRERNDGETRWLEDINPDSPTFGQRRSARTIQPGPDGGRRSRDGPPARPPQTAPPAAGSGLPAVGPEGQRVRNRNTNSIFVSRGGRWVPE